MSTIMPKMENAKNIPTIVYLIAPMKMYVILVKKVIIFQIKYA